MAKPSPETSGRPQLLALELWGLGDVALALPFLQAAAVHADVTLVAKPAAAPVLEHFAPAVRLLPLHAPWTAFAGKYRLHRWPWLELFRWRRHVRAQSFAIGVAVRRDPRDHALLAIAGARRRVGFARAGSSIFLTERLPAPEGPHRAEHWSALLTALGWSPLAAPAPRRSSGSRRIVVHTSAGQRLREWPRERYDEIATRLTARGWDVRVIDERVNSLPALLAELSAADRFIGNDSGPGHLAAALGVPTFTIFGPQLPELFAPQHLRAEWIEGKPCPFKPCWDHCRFPEPHCIRRIDTEEVWARLEHWLRDASPTTRPLPNCV